MAEDEKGLSKGENSLYYHYNNRVAVGHRPSFLSGLARTHTFDSQDF
jgi:hypothetical protein